jgi:hypothetical protein
MTRFLSQVLGAREPYFGQSIEMLERASGRPAADIRLSTAVMNQARAKIEQLGLDPYDTTGPELYGALQERLRQDEIRVHRALGIANDAQADDVVSAVLQFLAKNNMPKQCFALKLSVAKKLLKKRPPKSAMKQLNYRSLDSMLKHEPVPQILAAAFALEPVGWQRAFRDQYALLQPTDFEQREMTLAHPVSRHWMTLGSKLVAESHHNIACLKELGAVVMLPIRQDVDGLALTTLLLTLNYMNDIRAHSSYAKLQQVKPNFGKILQQSSVGEPYTSAKLAGQPVPWRVIQRFYSRFREAYHPEVFEPHVQQEDLQWHCAEKVLVSLDSALAFWQDTQCVAILHDGQPVSFNIFDVALSFCNHLSFEDRIVHFVRDHMWHELMMRYLNQANLEQAVASQLSSELVEADSLEA